jgi:tetratricopeptide (TPR) repeat protein
VEGNIADLCGRQGRLDEALEHFEHARRGFDQAHAPGDAARLDVERAETLLQLGLTSEARAAFESAATLLASLGMAYESARAVFGLGRVLASQGHLPQAAAALERAARELEALGHATGVRRVRLLRARVAMSMHDLPLARSLVEEVEASQELKPMERAELSITAAQLESLSGRHDLATRTIVQAIEIARAAGLPVLLAQSLIAAAKVHEHAGTPKASMARLADAMTTIERIRSSLRAESFRAALSGTFSDAYDDYVRLWLDGGGDASHAIETIERGRARALLDLIGSGSWLSDAAPADSADAALLASRTELCGLIAASHAGLHSGFSPAPARGKALDASELEKRLAEVERRLAATRRFSGEFAPAPDGRTIIASTPDDGCLIEYFTEQNRISAIVVRGGAAVAHRSLCTGTWLADALGSLRLHLSIASSRGLQVDGSQLENAVNAFARLGDTLLGPMLADLREASHVAIIADGHAASVPFQSLRVGGEWLIDLVDVVRAPSAGVLRQLQTRTNSADAAGESHAPTVVIGLSDERAPLAETECRTVAELTGADRVLLGAGATRHAAMAALKGAGRVHIATHARFVAHSPMQSAIKLADGWLTARDLHGAELAGGCVMLSACDSGRSGVSHGRELLGLGRALLAAGAESLILSQWLLHDAAASRIVSEVYGNARTTRSASRALRDAQRSERSRTPHPAAWGGLYVVGPWNSSEATRHQVGGVP